MKISVIGCGWLGLPLAEALTKLGHQVLGSTMSVEKLSLLESKQIIPVLLKLDPMPVGKGFNQLFQSEVAIINIPPRRKYNSPEFYEEQIKYLKYQLQQSAVKKVIFISSTSYYPNTNSIVDTDTLFDFEKGSSKAVVKGEQQISQIEQDLVILRCGGLMGKDRIPGRWFAGKPTKGGDNAVNYIHIEDVISVISELIEVWPQGNLQKVYNLVSPEHPKKRDVHSVMAQKYSFAPPIWEEPSVTPSKIVESDFKNIDLKSPLDY